MDSPVGTFDTSSPEKSKATDGTSNGISNPQISKASFSKILNRSINGKNEARGDRQTYRQSPLSREVAVTSEESPQVVTSNEKVEDSKFKEGSHHVESSNDGSQFHFSIYKWAGGGVPLMIPLRVGKSPKLEGKFNMARSASSNGRIEFDNLDNDRSECDNRDTEPASANSHSVSSNHESESLKVERREDTGNNQDGRESSHDANLDVLESKFLNGASKPADAGKATLNNKTVHQSSHQEEKTEKIRKEVDTNGSQAARPEKKPLSALLGDKVEAQGNNKEQNESFVKGARAPDSVPISNKEKKNDARRKTVNKVSVDKDDSPGSPLTTANTPGKTGVKGKVRDFVKIFNHETVGKTKTDLDSRSRSFRWKSTAKYAANSEGSSMNNTTEKAQFTRVDDKSNAFSKVDENPSKDRVNQPSNVKTSNNESRRNNDQKTSSFPESFHGTFNVTSETSEDLFQESFSVEELSEDQEKGLQTNEVPEDFQASDAKIQQWSNGRKGNIRSLLSTLQYVLWPESGWKPVPLVDIIEGNAVKRSYQRALLYLHPDKLQQKGASSQQKYIAEKVFDILQEAWDHFNSIGGL